MKIPRKRKSIVFLNGKRGKSRKETDVKRRRLKDLIYFKVLNLRNI